MSVNNSDGFNITTGTPTRLENWKLQLLRKVSYIGLSFSRKFYDFKLTRGWTASPAGAFLPSINLREIESPPHKIESATSAKKHEMKQNLYLTSSRQNQCALPLAKYEIA
jgi:hypothetical protein